MKKFTFLMMLAASIFTTQSVMGLTFNVTVPDGTYKCYITGDVTGGWWPMVEMTKLDDNHFTIDLPNATTTGEYKYYAGADWQYEEAINADGDPLTANRKYENNNGNDVVLFWKAVFVPDPLTTVIIDCWVPSTVHELYITGSFNSWGGYFNDDLHMSFVGNEDGGKVFTYQISTENLSGLEFKFVAGADWEFQQTAGNFKLADGFPDLVIANKYAYQISNVTDFQNVFDPALVEYITINATVPAADEVYVQGSHLGWVDFSNAPTMKMTKVDDTHFTYTTANKYQLLTYRLYNGANWSNPEQELRESDGVWIDRNARYVNSTVSTAYNVTVCKWLNNDDDILCEREVAGVKQINPDYFTVISDNGKIVVTNTKNSVEIYDIMGRMVESSKIGGDFTSKTLHTGIYLVRVDGFAEKVLVK